MTIARALKSLGWVLVVAAPFSWLAGVFSPFWLPQTLSEPLGKALSLTSVVPAGLLLTLGGILLAKSREATDAQEKRSLFCLDSCVAAYEEARNLLVDGDNDRGRWIAAARALKHAQKLSKAVTVDAHLRALEVHHLKYRKFFYDILSPKSAAFFYGAQDPATPLDAAAAASTAREERAGRSVTSTVNALSEKSLHAVWEAAQWPDDNPDPLDAGFSPEEEGRLLVLFPGLYEYLEHTRRFTSASGRLLSSTPGRKPLNP